jgi:hypothetical protein
VTEERQAPTKASVAAARAHNLRIVGAALVPLVVVLGLLLLRFGFVGMLRHLWMTARMVGHFLTSSNWPFG